MDFNSLLKWAQKMQEDMEKNEAALKEKEYTSTKLKDILRITMNGDYEVVKVELNEDFVKNFTSDDREILEDAITLAVNELTEQITDDKEGMLGDLAGSINIPGLR